MKTAFLVARLIRFLAALVVLGWLIFLLLERAGHAQSFEARALSASAPFAEVTPTPAGGQSVTVSYDLQPLQAFQAALLSKLPGVALYAEIACSSLDTLQTVSGGRILQYSRVAWIDRSLNDLTVERARNGSPMGRVLKVMGYLGVGAGVLGSPGWNVVQMPAKASAALSAAGPVFTLYGAYISGDFARAGAHAADLNLLRANESIELAPRACDQRMFLGSYQRGFAPHAAVF